MRKWTSVAVVIILLAGCGCIRQEKFTLTDITFCASKPADRAYDQKLDPTYVQGDTVWIYMEAFRFQSEEEGYLYVMSFDATLELYDAQGKFIRGGKEHIKTSSDREPVYMWFRFWIGTEDLEGTYTVRIIITDTLSGESAASEGTFFIVKENTE